MDSGPSGKMLLAYAICAEDWRHYAEGFEDLRDAPPSCPICRNPLYTTCPRCGMLYRTGTGICSNCGAPLHALARYTQPTNPQE